MATARGDNENLQAILKRLASTASPPSLAESEVELVATSLTPAATRSAYSLAYLLLSKLCRLHDASEDALTERVASVFRSFVIRSCDDDSDTERDHIPLLYLLASLIPLAPAAGLQLLTLPVVSLEPSPLDPLAILLDEAEIASPVQLALAEVLAAAAGTKPGREMVRSRALQWLTGALIYGDDTKLGSLAAVALSKLGQLDGPAALPSTDENEPIPTPVADEDLCRKMMSLVISTKLSSTTLASTLEGLSILSLRPHIRHLLAQSLPFLVALLALSPSITKQPGSLPVTPRGSLDLEERPSEPVDGPLCYGITAILVNITVRKGVMSAEDQQIAKLRAMAISGKRGQPEVEENVLEQDEAVRKRVSLVIKAGVIPALRGLGRADSRLVKQGLGTLCLNLVEDKQHRPSFVRDGGFRVLSTIVRDLLAPAKTPFVQQTLPSDSSPPSTDVAILPALQALAKLIITSPPHLLFPPPHLTTSHNALTPLYTLLVHPTSTLLQQFEALMALTNIASIDAAIANRMVEASVAPPKTDEIFRSTDRDEKIRIIAKVEELMLADNILVRRAATELVCNLVGCPCGFSYFSGEKTSPPSAAPTAPSTPRVNSRLNVILVLTDVDDLATRLAAGGALAVITESGAACHGLLSGSVVDIKSSTKRHRSTWSRVLSMLEPEDARGNAGDDADDDDDKGEEQLPVISSTLPDPGLVHRAVITLLNLVNHLVLLDAEVKKEGLRGARKAGVEERLLDILRSQSNEEILLPAIECLKILKQNPAGS